MQWMRLAAAAALLAMGSTAQAAPDRKVSYTLAAHPGPEGLTSLDVTIRLAADASGITTIDWADGWAGEHELGQWARDLIVDGADKVDPAPNGGAIVHSRPGARLTLRYRIVSAYAADPSVEDSEQARPVVRPGWFYSVGEVLYARPVGRDQAPADFRFEGPKGFGFASDTEHRIGLLGQKRTVADILESIAIGGRDLVVTRTMVNGAPVRVAHVGSFGFDVAAFDTLAEKVVAIERDFWRDPRPGPFLITAIPLVGRPGTLSYGGTGRSDAFATWLDHDAPLPGLAWLLAHEYFHSWNSRQLGRMNDDKTEPEAYWVSEGFTDFYARRLMLRSGLWTPEQFVESWNDVLRAYAASPFRAAPNADAAAKFWSDETAQKLPYQRGALLAALWDRQLLARRLGDLDTVLRAQRDRLRGVKEMPLLTTAVVDQIGRAGLDIRPDVDRYLTRGDFVLLPEDAFGACARVKTTDRPVFERGWDVDATSKAGNVLTGVDPASNAYAAGLRNGMKILRRIAGEPGNSTVDYVVEVQDGATKRTVTFRPAGKQTIRTQQIKLDKPRFAADPAKCTAALAG